MHFDGDRTAAGALGPSSSDPWTLDRHEDSLAPGRQSFTLASRKSYAYTADLS